MSNSKSILTSFDEVGMVIVDGNFSNRGKILFGNKILLKALGYSASEVLGKTVHALQPREIARVHDTFFFRFRDTGNTCVLD